MKNISNVIPSGTNSPPALTTGRMIPSGTNSDIDSDYNKNVDIKFSVHDAFLK